MNRTGQLFGAATIDIKSAGRTPEDAAPPPCQLLLEGLERECKKS